jgi:hypothetical protein
MKTSTRIICALGLSLSALSAWAVNNADVIKMTKAGLDEATVTAAVRGAAPAEFDTSADGLVKLKQSGVSESVIQAMIAKQSGGDSSSASPSAPAATIKYKNVEDSKVLPPPGGVAIGREYYTRYTSKYEGDEHSGTNYWVGETLPINTKVQLVKVSLGRFTLKRLDTGAKIDVVNVEKYTKRDTLQLAREMLADQPTHIDLYGKEMADAISSGTPRLGMTKTQVLLARGYPPSHETPSLDGPNWKYWNNRWVTHLFVFDGNILREARGLY